MDLDRIEQLVKLFGGSRATDLEVAGDGWHLSLRRHSCPDPGLFPVAPSLTLENGAGEEQAETDETVMITAPRVGIFRRGERRLAAGDWIEAGSPIGAIESVKIPNPVVAEVSGDVVEVLVEDGQPVEYSQPLLVVLPRPELAAEAET
jgi:biotin carboxyl carrier protein